MPNTREELADRFLVVSGAGLVQSAPGVAVPNEDLDTRDKCTITRELVVDRKTIFDCRDEYQINSKIRTRLARVTFNYTEVTPQIIHRWTAIRNGAAAAPTGTPADEIQRLTRLGTVSSGFFSFIISLEGRTVESKPLAWNATTTQIVNALTAARMLFVQPGDVTASGGTPQVDTLTVVGTCNANGNLPVTVIAANKPALAGAGKTINVAILDLDTASVVAGKIRAALLADADVGHVTTGFFTVSGAGAEVILTARTAVANDVTMALSYTSVLGMTGATSANTTAGVAGTDWGATGITLNFAERLRRANLPLITVNNAPAGVAAIGGGGSIEVAQITAGDQNYHASTVTAARTKERFTFAMGWDTDEDRVEKYIDYAVESINSSGSLDGDVAFSVIAVGPWDYDSIEETFPIPDCQNIDPLQTQDCRVSVDGRWVTTDVNSFNLAINDNIPVDRLSAFPFDGIDFQTAKRGRQPAHTMAMSLFGSEVDEDYRLAHDERSEDAVPVFFHFGMPGNRETWSYPETKIAFQTNPLGTAGTAELSTIQIDGFPYKDGLNPPFEAEAYLDQATAFLLNP